MKYVLLLTCLFLFEFCQQPSSEKKLAHAIAVSNGLDSFNKIQMIEFVFNAQKDTATPASRHWQWFPQTNEVAFISDSATNKFKRSDTSTAELKKLNARFTNDEYWLLYPLHLSWDMGYALTDSGMKSAPVSGKNLRKITTKYNSKEGFTPGDMYDLYIDQNQRIQEWCFHKTGVAAPSLITTWENYKNFDGLLIAQNHTSKDGKFRLWFSGIQIKK